MPNFEFHPKLPGRMNETYFTYKYLPCNQGIFESEMCRKVESRDNPLKKVARKEKKLCHNDTHQKEGRYKEVHASTSANFLPAEV